MPQGTKKPAKIQTAKLYALWKSIPFAFRQMSLEKLASLGCDVDDDIFVKLISCKTKKKFAEVFNTGERTLLRWDNSDTVQKMTEEFNRQSNVLRFKKEIDFNFTQKTIKESDAARVKLWKQLFEGWVEKSKTELGGDLKVGQVVDLDIKTKKLLDEFIKTRKNKI